MKQIVQILAIFLMGCSTVLKSDENEIVQKSIQEFQYQIMESISSIKARSQENPVKFEKFLHSCLQLDSIFETIDFAYIADNSELIKKQNSILAEYFPQFGSPKSDTLFTLPKKSNISPLFLELEYSRVVSLALKYFEESTDRGCRFRPPNELKIIAPDSLPTNYLLFDSETGSLLTIRNLKIDQVYHNNLPIESPFTIKPMNVVGLVSYPDLKVGNYRISGELSGINRWEKGVIEEFDYTLVVK
jgi:hypothetical protein